jgi:hypothetical protein
MRFRRAWLWACLAGLAMTGLSGCGTRHSDDALSCFTGRFALRAKPPTTSAGSLLRLSTNRPDDYGEISHDSWGTFGQAHDGRFEPLYSISAAVGHHGVLAHASVLPIDIQPLAGVALPNRPFLIRVPHVRSGRYLAQFYYSFAGLTTSERQRIGIGKRRGYYLCAHIRVLSRSGPATS